MVTIKTQVFEDCYWLQRLVLPVIDVAYERHIDITVGASLPFAAALHECLPKWYWILLLHLKRLEENSLFKFFAHISILP